MLRKLLSLLLALAISLSFTPLALAQDGAEPETNPFAEEAAYYLPDSAASEPMKALENPSFINTASWKQAQVDGHYGIQGAETGLYTTLLLTPYTSRPYIVYYDKKNMDLKLAYQAGANQTGNCGTNNRFVCMVADGATSNTGEYAAADMYVTNLYLRIGIAYRDGKTDGLKYARYSCPVIGACTWTYANILSGFEKPESYGYQNAIKFDSSGNPHIISVMARSDYSATKKNKLLYIRQVASGGNCGLDADAGKWQCDEIRDLAYADLNIYPSLVMVGGTSPRVAFFDNQFNELRLGYPAVPFWLSEELWKGPGKYPSLYIDEAGNSFSMRVAFYDAGEGRLMYGKYVGSANNPNCGFNPQDLKSYWHCEAIEKVDPVGLRMGLSLDVDSLGMPLIAYKSRLNSSTSHVRTATELTMREILNGESNCGPTVKIGIFPVPTWKCKEILKKNGSLDYGDFISLKIGVDGLAYMALTDYNAAGNTGLLFMEQRFGMFLPLMVR